MKTLAFGPVQARSAKEHKFACSLSHHPFRQTAAEAAYHEIALVRAEFGLMLIRYHLEPTLTVFKGHCNFPHACAEREMPKRSNDVGCFKDLER